MNEKNYKLLPKIKTSFQDQFCGSVEEITSTVKYVLGSLSDIDVKAEIGTKILLWEEDLDNSNKKYYLCNIGQIIELPADKIKEYSENDIPVESLMKLDDKIVMVKINKDDYFDLYDIGS